MTAGANTAELLEFRHKPLWQGLLHGVWLLQICSLMSLRSEILCWNTAGPDSNKRPVVARVHHSKPHWVSVSWMSNQSWGCVHFNALSREVYGFLFWHVSLANNRESHVSFYQIVMILHTRFFIWPAINKLILWNENFLIHSSIATQNVGVSSVETVNKKWTDHLTCFAKIIIGMYRTQKLHLLSYRIFWSTSRSGV